MRKWAGGCLRVSGTKRKEWAGLFCMAADARATKLGEHVVCLFVMFVLESVCFWLGVALLFAYGVDNLTKTHGRGCFDELFLAASEVDGEV